MSPCSSAAPTEKVPPLDEAFISTWITQGLLRRPHNQTDWHHHSVGSTSLIQLAPLCPPPGSLSLASDSSLSSQSLVQVFTILPTLSPLTSPPPLYGGSPPCPRPVPFTGTLDTHMCTHHPGYWLSPASSASPRCWHLPLNLYMCISIFCSKT